MPDHSRGCTKRGEGHKPTDREMAESYERRASHEPLEFDSELQRIIVEQIRKACEFLKCKTHACITEKTHVHSLLGWNHDRVLESVRASLKTSLTKRLHQCREGIGLSRGGSRKRVSNRDHFNYLMQVYLPDHSGVGWFEEKGWVNLLRKMK